MYIPEQVKATAIDIDNSKYKALFDNALDSYKYAKDPTDDLVMYNIGKMVQNAFPYMNAQQARQYAPVIMNGALGLDATPQKFGETLINVYKSTAKQLKSSMKFYDLMNEGNNNNAFGTEEFKMRKNEFIDEMRNDVSYRTDYMEFNPIMQAFVNAAEFAPSMATTLPYYLAGGVASVFMGNPAPTYAATALAANKSKQMEGGAVMRDLAMLEGENGERIPNELIWEIGQVVGILNGTLEVALDSFAPGLSKAFSTGVAAVTGKASIKGLLASGTIRQWGLKLLKDKALDMGKETFTEILQEFISMVGQNAATKIENDNRGKEVFEPISGEEMVNALKEIAVKTASGTAVFSVGGGTVQAVKDWNFGDASLIRNANKYSARTDDSVIVKMSSVVIPSTAAKATETTEVIGEKSADIPTPKKPIEVIKIGEKYRPVSNEDAEYLNQVDKTGAKAINVVVTNKEGETTARSSLVAKRLASRIGGVFKNGQVVFESLEESRKIARDYASKMPYVVGYQENGDGSISIIHEMGGKTFSVVFNTAENADKTEQIASTGTPQEPVIGQDENAAPEASQTPSNESEQTDEIGINPEDETAIEEPVEAPVEEPVEASEEAPVATPEEELSPVADEVPVEEAKRKTPEEILDESLREFGSDVADRKYAEQVVMPKLKEALNGVSKVDKKSIDALASSLTSLLASFAKSLKISLIDYMKAFYDDDFVSAKSGEYLNSLSSEASRLASLMALLESQGITDPEVIKRYLDGSYKISTAGVATFSKNSRKQQVFVNNDIKGVMSTLTHEFAHTYLRILDNFNSPYLKDMRRLYKEEFRLDDGKVGANVHERFAYEFEQYIAEGSTKSHPLKAVFEKLIDMIKDYFDVYHKALSEESKNMFDRILGGRKQKSLYDRSSSSSRIYARLVDEGFSGEQIADQMATFYNLGVMPRIEVEQLAEQNLLDGVPISIDLSKDVPITGKINTYTVEEVLNMTDKQYAEAFDLVTHEASFGVMNPTAVKKEWSAIENVEAVNLGSLKKYGKLSKVDQIAQLGKVISAYSWFNTGRLTNPESIIKKYKEFAKGNIRYLYEMTPESMRNDTRRWYVVANKLARLWSAHYGFSIERVSAAIATLSPQKDWFQNVSLAQRIMDIYLEKDSLDWDEFMELGSTEGSGMSVEYYVPKYEKGILKNQDVLDTVERLRGTKLSDLFGLLTEIDDSDFTAKRAVYKDIALWVRLYDETHHSRAYREMKTDATFGDYIRTNAGAFNKVAWGSAHEISNAIAALDIDNIEMLSDLLGDRHKVRNFYNNILIPLSDKGFVTIDTHAVAAALLMPLGGDSTEVAHNFGSGGKKPKGSTEPMVNPSNSSINGISGTYPIFASAYQEVAEELGIQARELQSVVWETVRKLFTDDFKSLKIDDVLVNYAEIMSRWYNYFYGNGDLNETRQSIIDYAVGEGRTLEQLLNERPELFDDAGERLSSYERGIPWSISGGQYGSSRSGGRSGDSVGLSRIVFEESEGGTGGADTGRPEGSGATGATEGRRKADTSHQVDSETTRKELESGNWVDDQELKRFAGEEWADAELEFRSIARTYPAIVDAFKEASSRLADEMEDHDLADPDARLLEIFNELLETDEVIEDDTNKKSQDFIDRLRRWAAFEDAESADAAFLNSLTNDNELMRIVDTIASGEDLINSTLPDEILRVWYAGRNSTKEMIEEARKTIKENLTDYRRTVLQKDGNTSQLSFENSPRRRLWKDSGIL